MKTKAERRKEGGKKGKTERGASCGRLGGRLARLAERCEKAT